MTTDRTNGKIDRYKGKLVIDVDALSECLVEQPDLYYHVTMEHARAVADRDEIKLELDELQAEVDRSVRAKAVDIGEKVTEAVIAQRVKLNDGIREKSRDLISARGVVDQWQSIKEAFQQRSFMLREIVALRISERSEQYAASGAGRRPCDPGTVMADENMRAGSEARRSYRVRRDGK